MLILAVRTKLDRVDFTCKIESMYDCFASAIAQHALAFFVDEQYEPAVWGYFNGGYVEIAFHWQCLRFVAD